MKGVLSFWKKHAFALLMLFLVLSIFDMRFALVAVFCMVGPIVLALFGKGRFWCGNICPRGNFYDRVMSKLGKKKKVPAFLKSVYFRVGVIAFMFYMFGTGIAKNWGNWYGIGMVFYRMIVMTTLVGVALSFVYNHRTWCNFCPMGSIAAFISRLKTGKKTLKVSNTCVSCKLCERKCPMGLAPYEYKSGDLSHPDCIQCGVCVAACPKKSISYEE